MLLQLYCLSAMLTKLAIVMDLLACHKYQIHCHTFSRLLACRYAENQELVNKNGAVINEQANMIADLEERLLKQQGAADSKGTRGDKSRIKELEADVEGLKVNYLPLLHKKSQSQASHAAQQDWQMANLLPARISNPSHDNKIYRDA